MPAVYVNGVKTSCIAIGGSTDISEVARLTETEWSNLQIKDNNKIYLICNDQKDMVRKMYQGDRRILKKEDISDYEFWYEDLRFPYYLNTSTGTAYSADRYAFDTEINPFSNDNKERSFEIDFKIINAILGHSYGNIIANHAYDSSKVFQIYYYEGESKVGFGFQQSGDHNTSSTSVLNKDIRMVFDRTESPTVTVNIYIDNVLDSTFIVTNFEYSNNALRIGLYDNYSPFNGCIDYIGFKWLD